MLLIVVIVDTWNHGLLCGHYALFVTKMHVVWKVMKGVYMGRGEGVAVATVKTVGCESSPLVSNL